MGKVNFTPVRDSAFFHMIQPFYFGTPTFELSPIITMTLVAIVSLVESQVFILLRGYIVKEDKRRGFN